MNDSTRRTARTVYHFLLAAVVVVPSLLASLPEAATRNLGQITAALLAGLAVVAKVLNLLEDKGLIPAWLKTPVPNVTVVVPDPPAAPVVVDNPPVL